MTCFLYCSSPCIFYNDTFIELFNYTLLITITNIHYSPSLQINTTHHYYKYSVLSLNKTWLARFLSRFAICLLRFAINLLWFAIFLSRFAIFPSQCVIFPSWCAMFSAQYVTKQL